METEFEDNSSDEENNALGVAAHLANEKRIEELQKTVIKQEAKLATADKEMEMTPLMLFLSSSLNVELVYTILYGIKKFTLLNFMRNEFSADQMRQFKAMEYRVDQFGDTTITIRQIRIMDIEKWDKMNTDDTMAMGRGMSYD